ncbi:MAG TPA: type II secretion system protein GspG [Porticoccaceae bacterium]|jgi:general secretion pathway protein G|nr:type II secretion system major pseudopilin GspG [Porticoccaceae bacterium]HAZ95596.1 type II secretion system protein GspG [Porticoccaceae bacterium]|tara:strand:- start:459 stop:890 length:432 start_codon:yes stop_codon:yes gene_type:complete
MTTNNRQAGFTLIEMMVVVVVIALLGAMIGPTLFKKVQQAEETRVAQDIRTVESALKFYRLDNYRYPSQAQGLNVLLTPPTGNGAAKWNGPYLESMPADPWGEPYKYANPGTHGKDIEVFTLGVDNQVGGEGSDKDWGNWNIR